MSHTCRSANMRYFMRDNDVYAAAKEMIDAYEEMQDEDRRGTRIRESFREDHRLAQEKKIFHPGMLNEAQTTALERKLNAEAGWNKYTTVLSRTPGRLTLRKEAIFLSHLSLQGVSYKARDRSLRDSNIIFKTAESPHDNAGRITSIFRHTRSTGEGRITETFIVVDKAVELNKTDAARDPYRTFQWFGGRLFYDAFEMVAFAIRPSQVVSHCARTPMQLEGIAPPCVHVLPLNRVSLFHSPSST